MTTVAEALREGAAALAEASADPGLEARVLLRRAGGLTDLEILAYPGRRLPAAAAKRFRARIAARLRGSPLALVLGEKEFWSIPFQVTRAVLVPRPETELLVETVLAFAPDGPLSIVEIGTGCGAVAVALARELPEARITATDVSRRALRVARRNADLQAPGRIAFLAGDLFAPLREAGSGPADVIVSNPPYVAEGEWPGLAAEIREYEPRRALVAGPTGLEAIGRIVRGSSAHLVPGGRLVLEIGAGQASRVRALFGAGWSEVRTERDLRGIERVVSARLAGARG